jgi:alanine racemase
LRSRLEKDGIRFDLVHAANSAGIVYLPESRLNMVRPGLLVYGLLPGRGQCAEIEVQPVMSFKSCVVQLRKVRKGRFISYSRTYCASKDSVIAVVPVGYGHGYSWTLSNAGEMLVRGKRVPIVGRVTMDLTMLDVTDVAGVKEGDEVVLFGKQDSDSISAEEVAAKAGTLSYEILCSIGKRVVRSFIRNNKPSKVITLVGERKEVDRVEDTQDCQPAIRYISVPAIRDERG